MRLVATTLVIGTVLLLASTATGAPPDTSTEPLEQAAFVAIPAVYELRVILPVSAVIEGGVAQRIDQNIEFRGTAFGVAPNRVATARHLVRPPTERIAEELAGLGVTGLPDVSGAVRFATDRPELRLRRATTAAAAAGNQFDEIAVEEVVFSDRLGDVAVMTISDPDAPTLRLVDAPSAQTDVAIIGFGDGGPDPVPALRLGIVQATAQIRGTDDSRFAVITADVRRGDSGGPAITADGDVVGLVIRRASNGVPPVVARVGTIRRVLDDEGVVPQESDATVRFGAAMTAFWRRDYDSAATILDRQGDLYRDASLARHEAARARELERAEYAISGPSRIDRALWTGGLMAAFAAVAFAALRLRRQRPAT